MSGVYFALDKMNKKGLCCLYIPNIFLLYLSECPDIYKIIIYSNNS